MLSSKTLPEQNFGELAESENSNEKSPKTINSSSFLSFEELQSFIMEEIQISYEVIENYGTSKNQFNLLKIINESDVQNQNIYYCIIVNFTDELLKQKIKIDISRYSFETKFFDFTDWQDQKDSLVLSDSTSTTEPQVFKDYVSINSQFCRIIVFSQEFDQKIIDLINNYPYIYYCNDVKIVKEEYLESLKLHQHFQQIDINYKMIKHLISTSLSRLKDIKFVGIQIKGCIEYVDKIDQIKIHPLIDYQRIGKKQIQFKYDIPFIIINSYFYLPIPLSIKNLEIKDYLTQQFQSKPVHISSNINHIEEYDKIYILLNSIQDQIKKDELFFSINSNKEFNSLESLLTLNQVNQIQDLKNQLIDEDHYLNLIEKILIYFSQCLKSTIEKYILFVQLKHLILYRLHNSYLNY
ncbi:unnamed protein product [Paramecium pentaurelia]|uniref:Uncharacterized protein n=1 Tax=Paramecium pentaurelia TaxID=43138 RepID=A0A8S1T4V1_9CILI|nr:unnamed protein product [Paramecium pentaurelia]